MVQPGDTVRYLNEVGGGIVTRVEGKIAYVDDAGFETPMQVSDLVVVLPAGHTPANKGAKLMFDQEAFDTGRTSGRNRKEPEPARSKQDAPEPPLPVVETEYGDALNILLAFEPADRRRVLDSDLGVVLVNDSNYFLQFILLRRDPKEGWSTVFQGEAGPNELVDLDRISRDRLPELERIVFQAIAYKKGKPFEVKTPLNVGRKIDLTKFYKLHCFNPGLYFDTPVIEVPLINEPDPRAAAATRETRRHTGKRNFHK